MVSKAFSSSDFFVYFAKLIKSTYKIKVIC